MKKYVYLAFIIVISIIATFYLVKQYKNYFFELPVSVLLENPYRQITPAELKIYIIENPSSNLVVVNDTKNDDKILNAIKNNNLLGSYLFMNGSLLDKSQLQILNEIIGNENLNNEITKESTILFIRNGEVKEIFKVNNLVANNALEETIKKSAIND